MKFDEERENNKKINKKVRKIYLYWKMTEITKVIVKYLENNCSWY